MIRIGTSPIMPAQMLMDLWPKIHENCRGLLIENEPICCAVPLSHPLSGKEKLSVQDLYGQNLMMIHRGWCRHMDDLRDDLTEHHPQINLVNFDLYDVGVSNQCEQN